MDYKKLGSSGLEVSAITLGCMSYGDPQRGSHDWTLTEEQSRPFIRRALELGITTFDTANVYSDGSSEEIVGRALGEFARREEVVIATKVHGRMRPGPNGGGLSRKAILTEIDASLRGSAPTTSTCTRSTAGTRRCRSRRRWRRCTTSSRRARPAYIGASSMFAWQFAKAQYTADLHGWTRFVSMQDHYNLLNREEEREMHPVLPRPGRRRAAVEPARPRPADARLGRVDRALADRRVRQDALPPGRETDRQIVDAVASVAAARRGPRAQVALAWVAGREAVTSPIVGATKLSHLEDAVAALELHLDSEEVAELEAAYVPHAVAGF